MSNDNQDTVTYQPRRRSDVIIPVGFLISTIGTLMGILIGTFTILNQFKEQAANEALTKERINILIEDHKHMKTKIDDLEKKIK